MDSQQDQEGLLVNKKAERYACLRVVVYASDEGWFEVFRLNYKKKKGGWYIIDRNAFLEAELINFMKDKDIEI